MKRMRGILVSGKRFAIACSALPWVRGSSSFGMSSGSCCRSASIRTAYWAFAFSAAFFYDYCVVRISTFRLRSFSSVSLMGSKSVCPLWGTCGV